MTDTTTPTAYQIQTVARALAQAMGHQWEQLSPNDQGDMKRRALAALSATPQAPADLLFPNIDGTCNCVLYPPGVLAECPDHPGHGTTPQAPAKPVAPFPFIPSDIIAAITRYGDERADEGPHSPQLLGEVIAKTRAWASNLATPPAQEVQADRWLCECVDADYSRWYWHKTDALSHLSDHPGKLVALYEHPAPSVQASQAVPSDAVTLDLDARHMAVLEALADEQKLSKAALLRQALRLYQAIHIEQKHGRSLAYKNSDGSFVADAMLHGPLAATPAAQPVAQTGEWLLIETAPKDGRTLLLGYLNAAGKWRTVRGQWFTQATIAEEWEDCDEAPEGWYETSVESEEVPNCWYITPTHWQLLPAPPTAQTRAEPTGSAS